MLHVTLVHTARDVGRRCLQDARSTRMPLKGELQAVGGGAYSENMKKGETSDIV